MEHCQIICCRHCGGNDTFKNGHRSNGTQRWRCNDCKRSFQIDYTYTAHKPGVKEQIIELTMNSAGVRDISRSLGIAKDTVIAELKKTPEHVNPYILKDLERQCNESRNESCNESCPEQPPPARREVTLHYTTQWDEMWSFVGSKANQRWLWYAMDAESGRILAWHSGRRTEESLQALIEKIKHLPIVLCHTDAWGGYQRMLPEEWEHCIGKANTWKIERKNLDFRTHLKRLSRRTICFSKSEEIHDNVIGLYINRHYFRHGVYSQSLL